MRKSRLWIIILVIVIIVGIGAIGTSLGAQDPVPLRLLRNYPMDILLDEASTMNDCVECHEPTAFHTCDTCHDDHGAIELEDIPFYAVISLVGDVPEPGYVLVDDVLPYRDQPHTYVPLVDFLNSQGADNFESVTLASNDEGFVTIDHDNLTENALLMPYEDGIRFASEDLHVSTWIKGITRIIVVGPETPLRIDGQATSMGRLLLGPTRSATVEQTDVMLKSESDGQIRKAKTASRIQGAPIETIIAKDGFSRLVVRDGSDQEHTLTAEEVKGAMLSQVRGQATLILPDRGRAQWLVDVVEILSQ